MLEVGESGAGGVAELRLLDAGDPGSQTKNVGTIKKINQ